MTPIPPALLEMLSRVLAGQASCDELVERLQEASSRPPGDVAEGDRAESGGEMDAISGATVDLGRRDRCGFSEVIYGPGKSPQLITDIIRSQLAAGQESLVTRLDAAAADQVRSSFEHAFYHAGARTLRVSAEPIPPAASVDRGDKVPHHVAVVTAGSTDGPVADEACETLAWMGIPLQRFDDIGVAGPQRLLSSVPRIRLASSVVVAAGMEGALPAAVAGHLAAPVFAVPTSVGYGASLGGLTAMLGMLSSCASNVAVVNIDAGFKAGYLAGLIVRQLETASQSANRSISETME